MFQRNNNNNNNLPGTANRGVNQSTDGGSIYQNRLSFQPENSLVADGVEGGGNAAKFDQSKADKLKNLISSFSWVNAFRSLKTTKCYEWDNKELDVLEGFKFVAFVML